MKKIQLTDGLPSSTRRKDEKASTGSLADKIKRLCNESGISYTEVNKALYLADTELYVELLNKES